MSQASDAYAPVSGRTSRSAVIAFSEFLEFRHFDTRAALAAALIPPSLNAVLTFGYYDVNDGGGSVWGRAATEPSHALKVQSADGAWWELQASNGTVNIRQAGAKSDATTDDTAAVQSVADWAFARNGGKIVFPLGVTVISGITLDGSPFAKRAGHIEFVGESPRGLSITQPTSKLGVRVVTNSATATMFDFIDTNDIRMTGLFLGVANGVTRTGGHCVRLTLTRDQARDFTMSDCVTSGFVDTLRIQGNSGFVLQRCEFGGCIGSYGVQIEGPSIFNGYIQNCQIFSGTAAGVNSTTCDGLKIDRGVASVTVEWTQIQRFNRNLVIGENGTGTSTIHRFTNFGVEGSNTHGIHIVNGQKLIFTNLNATLSDGTGMKLEANAILHIEILGGEIAGNVGHAIHNSSPAELTLMGVTLRPLSGSTTPTSIGILNDNAACNLTVIGGRIGGNLSGAYAQNRFSRAVSFTSAVTGGRFKLLGVNMEFIGDGTVAALDLSMTRNANQSLRDCTGTGVTGFVIENDRWTQYAAAIPTSGTFKDGDEVIFTDAVAGGFRRAVCTTAGTPGTWKNWGAIAS